MVVLLVLSVIFKQDFFSLVGGGGVWDAAPPGVEAPPANETPEERQTVQFVSFVLDSTQSFWERAFAAKGARSPRQAGPLP